MFKAFKVSILSFADQYDMDWLNYVLPAFGSALPAASLPALPPSQSASFVIALTTDHAVSVAACMIACIICVHFCPSLSFCVLSAILRLDYYLRHHVMLLE